MAEKENGYVSGTKFVQQQKTYNRGFGTLKAIFVCLQEQRRLSLV